MKEVKYPVAYALMQINYFTSVDSEGNQYPKVFGYVAAPCYVISETKMYHEDGSTSMKYEVVFCKEIMNLYNEEVQEVIPDFHSKTKQCTNSKIVGCINIDFYNMYMICEEKNNHVTLQFDHNNKKQYEEKVKQYYKVIK